MTESPELRTERIENGGTPRPTETVLSEKGYKEVEKKNVQVQASIKEKEFRSEIHDFLKSSNLSSSIKTVEEYCQAEEVLFNQYFPFFQSVEGFSIHDLPLDEVMKLLQANATEKSFRITRETKRTQVSLAEKLKSFVDQLKLAGLSNTAIIKRILIEANTGGLTVPAEKIDEYRNYLTALNSSEIPEKDKSELTRILDNSSFDITAGDSFEQFGKEVLNSRTISEKTKQILIKEFKIRPVVTGHDLKAELLSRHQLIRKRKGEIGELNENLASLNEDERSHESDLQRIRSELDNPKLSETQKEKLKKEADEIESAISVIKEQQKEIKDSRKILVASTPKHEIQLGEAKASYADEQIEVQLPDSRNYLRLPIEMSPEDITRSVNAYLVYTEFKKRGLEGIVFPDERLQDGVDLPSELMRNFVNQMLDTIGMSQNDEILTLEQLEEFNRYLDCFSSQFAKGSPTEERNQFENVVSNENGVFSSHLMINHLTFLNLHQADDKFSYMGLSRM